MKRKRYCKLMRAHASRVIMPKIRNRVYLDIRELQNGGWRHEPTYSYQAWWDDVVFMIGNCDVGVKGK